MTLAQSQLIVPEWPAPARVRALQTTRLGGFSLPPYDSLNLGTHVGDHALTVEANRNLLNTLVPSEPVWLEQVHGTRVVVAEQANCVPQADACVSFRANSVCAVMTADCLPVLLCDTAGTVVGAAHAGWRGLVDGVIESTVEAMGVATSGLMAWMGPAISPHAFEVGAEVRQAFMQKDPAAERAFTQQGDKYLADLYLLARQRMAALGIAQIYGGNLCTFSDPARFYSYRRDGKTGRMATMIWLSTT